MNDDRPIGVLWSGKINGHEVQTVPTLTGTTWVESARSRADLTVGNLMEALRRPIPGNRIGVPQNWAPILTALAETTVEEWDQRIEDLEAAAPPKPKPGVYVRHSIGTLTLDLHSKSIEIAAEDGKIDFTLGPVSGLLTVAEAEDVILFLTQAIEKAAPEETREAIFTRALERAVRIGEANARNPSYYESRPEDPDNVGEPTEAQYQALTSVRTALLWAKKDERGKLLREPD